MCKGGGVVTHPAANRVNNVGGQELFVYSRDERDASMQTLEYVTVYCVCYGPQSSSSSSVLPI